MMNNVPKASLRETMNSEEGKKITEYEKQPVFIYHSHQGITDQCQLLFLDLAIHVYKPAGHHLSSSVYFDNADRLV